MRIPEPKAIARTGPVTEVRPRGDGVPVEAEPVSIGDRVSTDASEDVKAAAAAVRRELGDSRQAHIAAIEAAVRSGNYRPDPRVIAEKILQAAVLDAEISAKIGRR